MRGTKKLGGELKQQGGGVWRAGIGGGELGLEGWCMPPSAPNPPPPPPPPAQQPPKVTAVVVIREQLCGTGGGMGIRG